VVEVGEPEKQVDLRDLLLQLPLVSLDEASTATTAFTPLVS